MLVLTRKVQEKIVINGDIVITVVDVGHGRVKLGIEAPRHVPVQRIENLSQTAPPAVLQPAR